MGISKTKVKIEDLKVGDVVSTMVGNAYVITSTETLKSLNPILKNYIQAMSGDGRAKDLWVPDIKEVLGHVDLDIVFDEMKMFTKR